MSSVPSTGDFVKLRTPKRLDTSVSLCATIVKDKTMEDALTKIIEKLQGLTATDYVAGYGALIATLSILIPLFKDRSKVKIRFNTNRRILGHPGISKNTTVCTIEVINLGKHPVSLSQVGLYMNQLDKPISIFADSMSGQYPRVLTQEQPRTEIPAFQEGMDLTKIIYAWAKDNKTKEYRLYISKIPTIRLAILKVKRWLQSKNKVQNK